MFRYIYIFIFIMFLIHFLYRYEVEQIEITDNIAKYTWLVWFDTEKSVWKAIKIWNKMCDGGFENPKCRSFQHTFVMKTRNDVREECCCIFWFFFIILCRFSLFYVDTSLEVDLGIPQCRRISTPPPPPFGKSWPKHKLFNIAKVKKKYFKQQPPPPSHQKIWPTKLPCGIYFGV